MLNIDCISLYVDTYYINYIFTTDFVLFIVSVICDSIPLRTDSITGFKISYIRNLKLILPYRMAGRNVTIYVYILSAANWTENEDVSDTSGKREREEVVWKQDGWTFEVSG